MKFTEYATDRAAMAAFVGAATMQGWTCIKQNTTGASGAFGLTFNEGFSVEVLTQILEEIGFTEQADEPENPLRFTKTPEDPDSYYVMVHLEPVSEGGELCEAEPAFAIISAYKNGTGYMEFSGY